LNKNYSENNKNNKNYINYKKSPLLGPNTCNNMYYNILNRPFF